MLRITRSEQLTPPGVTPVAFRPGGTVATGNSHGSIYLWHITYG
jgi:hypothetical protein